MLLFVLLFIVFSIVKTFQESFRKIDDPLNELISRVEQKYLNNNLKVDFKDHTLFTGDCDNFAIKNSQNITIFNNYIYFDDEVRIPMNKLTDNSRNLLNGIYENMKNKCILDEKSKKIDRELKLIK